MTEASMIVTCKLMGGIGNNLFQIANLLSYSLKYKLTHCVPYKIDNPHYNNQKVFISQYISYGDLDTMGAQTYKEPFYHYAPIPPPQAELTVLDGYFQSSRYIEPYKEEVLELLDIPVGYRKGEIFLHYRLGDYKRLEPYHKIISDEYIKEAILYFYSRGFNKFIVFSDGIDEAEYKLNGLRYIDELHNKELFFEFSEGRTEIEDLAFMASCEGGIMSASSFSWWGAYLGKEDKEIVYPRDWFGESLKHDTKDLFLSNWIAL